MDTGILAAIISGSLIAGGTLTAAYLNIRASKKNATESTSKQNIASIKGKSPSNVAKILSNSDDVKRIEFGKFEVKR